MTGANRLPTQQTTRGLRCQSVPTPAQAARKGLKAALPCQESASPTPSPDASPPSGLGTRGGMLCSCSNGPAVESGEGQMGNVKAPETGMESQMKELYRERRSDPPGPRVMRRGP